MIESIERGVVQAGLSYGYPPVVYVPCAEHVQDPADLRVEYKIARDGRKALLVYSALDRLFEGLGDAQPWFVAPTAKLELLWEVDPFDLLLLDVLVPAEHQRQAPQSQAEGDQP